MYDGQFGFRKHRSTTDAIYNIRKIIESCNDYNKPLYLAFVDITKAYDSINRNILWDALRDHKVPEYIITLIQSIYHNTTANVRIGDTFSENFSIGVGVKQGDILSPILFNIYLNFLWRKTVKRWEGRGITLEYGEGEGGNITWNENKSTYIKQKLNTKYISFLFQSILYADDAVIAADSYEDLRTMLEILDQELIERGSRDGRICDGLI